ncbi:MAG: phosphoenolpyruvate synthase, partial [Bacteroidales bacterium]
MAQERRKNGCRDISEFYMKDTSFANLMQKRIFNVLLIASRYDAFMLEEDGRVEEHIFLEYMSLNLSSPPRVTQINNAEEAVIEINNKHYDLIIVMPAMQNNDIFRNLKELKARYSDIPIVLLTPFSNEVSRKLENEDLSGVDYTFSWLGNADLLLAIVKLIEDKMNIEEDVASVGVQVILLVEDSVRFYSSLLPILYKVVLKQSQKFSTEALNRHEQMLRMRGRPKIMLARSYEEAKKIYDKYSNNMLGVVTDISFSRNGKKDPEAGIKLCRYLRSKDEDLPIIIDSSDVENRKSALDFNAAFLYKQTKTLPVDLKNAVLRNFGYGDFEFIRPITGEVIATVKDLKDLQNTIFSVPDESILYHASRN